MDIAEVARRSGVPASTLRFYEEKGLIASVGRRGLRRVFDPGVLERLALIALGGAAGFSLDEIAHMFAPDGRPSIDRQMLAAGPRSWTGRSAGWARCATACGTPLPALPEPHGMPDLPPPRARGRVRRVRRAQEESAMPVTNAAPIGVFDSGVGGLSVLREIRNALPAENLIYVADSGFAPYGDRPSAFIRQRAEAIVEFFAVAGAKACVVACNTATAVAVQGATVTVRVPDRRRRARREARRRDHAFRCHRDTGHRPDARERSFLPPGGKVRQERTGFCAALPRPR